MISPVASSAVVSQVQTAQAAASAVQTQQAALQPDSVNISQQGKAAAAAGHDGDGDGH
ncbi:hypothetical protein C7378_2099 [Acidipila rosea]|uniref:Uncharacterized protein n=1 Tax=Acidipila rosea TaxID=768535 RepID=A0A4R1L5R3_9BACT|nr:hypothetical protein C7378_2099 [Acidipila rosea]